MKTYALQVKDDGKVTSEVFASKKAANSSGNGKHVFSSVEELIDLEHLKTKDMLAAYNYLAEKNTKTFRTREAGAKVLFNTLVEIYADEEPEETVVADTDAEPKINRAKKAKPKKEGGVTRQRMALDTKLCVHEDYAKANPFREGSKSNGYMDLFIGAKKTGLTRSEALDSDIPSGVINWLVKQEYICIKE